MARKSEGEEKSMRAVLYLVLIVLVLALVGWITFNRDPNRPGVNLETQKMKDDTKRAMETGSDLFKKAEKSMDRAASRSDEPANSAPRDEPVPVATPAR